MSKPIKSYQVEETIVEIYPCYGSVKENHEFVVIVRSEALKMIRHMHFKDLDTATTFAEAQLCL